jgi:hypothetical protein
VCRHCGCCHLYFCTGRKKDSICDVLSLGSSELYLSHPSLVTFLAKFKMPQQAKALEVVLSRNQHLLLFGPTTMGKSLVYMLPSQICHPQKVMCVVLPLSVLHMDFFHQCVELKLENGLPISKNHQRHWLCFTRGKGPWKLPKTSLWGVVQISCNAVVKHMQRIFRMLS